MSLFEYIAILVSLVLGLSISNTLTKVSLLLQFGQNLAKSWHVLVWSLLVLFSAVGYFFGFWTMYSGRTDISILEFTIAPFFTAILLYLLSNFLPVSITEKSSTSISDYFLKHKNAFFLCFTLMWLQLLLTVNALGLTTQFSLLQQSQYVLPLILIATSIERPTNTPNMPKSCIQVSKLALSFFIRITYNMSCSLIALICR